MHTRHRQVDFDFIALRFYATSTVALYLATLDALTILPRKARRDPRYALELDASILAYVHETPPYGYAL